MPLGVPVVWCPCYHLFHNEIEKRRCSHNLIPRIRRQGSQRCGCCDLLQIVCESGLVSHTHAPHNVGNGLILKIGRDGSAAPFGRAHLPAFLGGLGAPQASLLRLRRGRGGASSIFLSIGNLNACYRGPKLITREGRETGFCSLEGVARTPIGGAAAL